MSVSLSTELTKLVRYQLDPNHPPMQHGQGAVWKAEDLLFGDVVALKEVRVDLREDPKALESFRAEAAAGARLGRKSPNIVQVKDYGRIENVEYFSMEWIAGGSLSSRCGCVSLREATTIMRQVCGAVQVAHAHRVIHSDIAPANILYDTRTDTYKLADFGYLKVLDSSLISRGVGSMLVGGRTYFLPPEHLHNVGRINLSTDIYALALTFHMLLTGEKLKQADDQGHLAVPSVVMVKHDRKPAPFEFRQLLLRFVEGRNDDDTAEAFRKYLDRIP